VGEDHFENSYEDLERISFSDGAVLTYADITAKMVADNATTGDDSITGSYTSDTLYGGAGNDTLNGSSGADVYQYALGDGHDLIKDYSTSYSQNDELQFTDLLADDVTFSQNSGKDLVITMSDGSTVTVQDHFENSYEDLERISFSDGAVLTYADITAKMVADNATTGDDSITGSYTSDTLYGGAGNDTLNGGTGTDVYQYALGDGHDLIKDYSTSSSQKDELVFSDISASELTLLQDNEHNLVIEISGGGSITVQDHFKNSYYDLEIIEFSDGTVWTDSQISSNWVWVG